MKAQAQTLARPTASRVAAALLDVIAPSATPEAPVPWLTIVGALEKEFAVRNWLTEVRGPLQFLLNQGVILRVADVRREAYYRVVTS
jgi:hypothetical protein